MALVRNINGILCGSTGDVNAYRGRFNEIVINTQTKQFRLMDGKALGGQSFAVSAVVDNLSDIGDVLLSSLSAGQALVWSGTHWVNSTVTATIADGSITAAKLASNSVIEAKILDGAVTNAKLAGSIALSKLSSAGVNGQVIRLNGGVATYSDFSFANLSGVALIGSPTAGQVLIYNTTGSSGWKNYTLSGDVTVNSTGVTSIGSEKVTNSMLAGSIALSKLSTSGASTGSVIKFDGTSWAIGSDTNTTSLSGLTTDVLISSPSEAQVLIYDNADNKWKNKILSGEISINKAGVATLAPSNGSIALGKLSQGGASSGQVIAWDGTAWAPANGGGGSDLATLGWDIIIDADPTEGLFPEIGTGDRGFILQGTSNEAKVAFYYDDSSNRVFLKGNQALEGADIYIESGSSTTSQGGRLRLYGGDAFDSGDPEVPNISDGGYVQIYGGDCLNTSGDGGYVRIQGGESTDRAGGYVEITAGSSNGVNGYGGSVNINAGSSSFQPGGYLNLNSGAGTTGGSLNLTTGVASNGDAGGISLTTGYSTNGNGGEINLVTNIGTFYGNSSGNINLVIGSENTGASEGRISLQGKTELTKGFVSDVNIYNPDDTLVHGTVVYVFVRYGADSFASGEQFHIFKTADNGSTRQIVPLTIVENPSIAIARKSNSSLYEYTGIPTQAFPNVDNVHVGYFVMDTEGGTYNYFFKGNANVVNASPFYAACSIISAPTIETPLVYTEIFATGLSDREFLLSPTNTNVELLPPPGLFGASSTFNQVSLLASVDSTTGELFLENLKASVPSIPGNKGVVGANDQGVVSLVDNFNVHIPTVQHRDILRYDATQSKWQATGFIEPVFVGTYIPVADGRTYYHFDIVDPLVVLPSNGVQGDVFYVQLGPNQNRLTFKVPSPIPRLTAFYQGFLVSHPTNMYSGYEVGDPDYWAPSEFYNGNTETISENYMGTDTVVIPNFGGLVEFRCYPVNNQGLSETETEYTWHVSVLSGQKPAKYTPIYFDIQDTPEGPVVGKSCYLSRSEFVSNKLYYYIGNNDVIVDINLPILCPAMEGIELNIKQTGLQDMYINSNMGLIEGESQFIMSEKGSMATLINDGINWYLA